MQPTRIAHFAVAAASATPVVCIVRVQRGAHFQKYDSMRVIRNNHFIVSTLLPSKLCNIEFQTVQV